MFWIENSLFQHRNNISWRSMNLFLKEVDEYVKCLEEEMKKIDAFKRELPLCMLLLNDAIGTLRGETMQWKSTDVGAVMEKIVPLKGNENDLREDKKNWMSSVQLWTTSNGYSNNNKTITDEIQKPVHEMNNEEKGSAAVANENIFPRNGGGGAFVPFKGFSGFLSIAKIEEKEKDAEKLESGLSLFCGCICWFSFLFLLDGRALTVIHQENSICLHLDNLRSLSFGG